MGKRKFTLPKKAAAKFAKATLEAPASKPPASDPLDILRDDPLSLRARRCPGHAVLAMLS